MTALSMLKELPHISSSCKMHGSDMRSEGSRTRAGAQQLLQFIITVVNGTGTLHLPSGVTTPTLWMVVLSLRRVVRGWAPGAASSITSPEPVGSMMPQLRKTRVITEAQVP